MTLPRLNGIIRAFEGGKPAFASFCPPEPSAAVAFSDTRYDGIVIETEHNPYVVSNLRDTLQYLLSPRKIVSAGTVAPPVTPIVRIPPNGGEGNQHIAKQVLDIGAYGVVWPHIANADEAYNAVASCRYPRPKDAPRYQPAGVRGDGPGRAVRYWGIGQSEYYARADVWPLAPDGEILVVVMIEDVEGVANIEDILRRVDGIGLVLIGEGDLSQNLGHPRQYDHPLVREAMAQVVGACKANGVRVGHPHVGTKNIERVLEEGYDFLMTKPTVSYAALDKGLELTGR